MASLPIAAGALLAARPFARAAVRYRILAVAFALTVAVGPAALLAASLRPAGRGLAAGGGGDVISVLALPAELVALAAAAALLVELACDVVKLRRVKRHAVTLGTAPVRRARIGTSRTVSTPTAIGYLHPAVVLPENFRTRVDEREWHAVVAHECAHLARGDDWAKAVQSAVTRAGWWLPGLWMLGRGLDLERELASDERAMLETGPRRYAACLLRLATDRDGAGLAPAFGARRSHVAIRVERLLRPSADCGPLRRAAALGAFTAAALAIVATALAVVPGTARQGSPLRHPSRLAAQPAPRAAAAHPALRTRAPLVAHRAALLAVTAPGTAPDRAAEPPSRAFRARPVQSPQASVVAVRAAAPVPVAVRPVWRAPSIGRTPVARRDLELGRLAFVPPSLRCRTCFGPLRSPDDAVALSTPVLNLPPSADVAAGGAAAIAAEDPTSGPVSLGTRTVWFRIPARAIPTP